MYFWMNNAELAIVLVAIIGGSIVLGVLVGRRVRRHPDAGRESVGAVQAAVLGFVGLVLAFGLTMAVGRYESRRLLVVTEANAIGTTFLRAQLLSEPERTRSIDLLRGYADAAISFADEVPDTGDFLAASDHLESVQRELWAAAGRAVAAAPQDTAPRLYVETLNDTIDSHAERINSLRNRVPSSVMALEVIGSAIALGVLALYLTMLGKGVSTTLFAAVVVILILFVSFDLDRPKRGFIRVPSAPLVDLRTSMLLEPAAGSG